MDKKNRYCKGYTAWLAHAKKKNQRGGNPDEEQDYGYGPTGYELSDSYKQHKAREKAGDNRGTTYGGDVDKEHDTAYSGLGNTGSLSTYKKMNELNRVDKGAKASKARNYGTQYGPEPLYNAPSKGTRVEDIDNWPSDNAYIMRGVKKAQKGHEGPSSEYNQDILGFFKSRGGLGSSSQDTSSGSENNKRGSGRRPYEYAQPQREDSESDLSKPSSWDPDSSSYRDWKKKYNQSYYRSHRDYWRKYYGVKSPKAPSSATANMYRDETYKQAAEARSRAQYDRTNYDRRSNAQKMLDRSAADRNPERTTFGKELFNAKSRLNDMWAEGAGSIASAGKSFIKNWTSGASSISGGAKNARTSFNDMWANGASTIAKAGKSFLDAWKSGLKR